MAKDYLTEAFEALKILNEDTFDVNDQGVKELKLFLDQDENLPEEEVVIDPLAETEEDLQDSYEGKVILMCPICQSKIYKAPEEVVISDENVVNIEESCPYCQCNEGYKIIGQVAPFKPEESKEEKEDVDLDEALGIKNEEESKKALKNERLFRNKKIAEDFEKVDIETDKEKMSMTADEDGKVTVTTEPKVTEEAKEEVEEVIAPLETETEDKFQEVDVDEFDEEEFDELGEKYLRQVYENVKSYKTLNGKVNGNTLKLEGLITFKSGKQVKTNFVFEAKSINAKGKVKFLGENKQFAKGKNAFTLSGKISKGKLIAESLNYNYRAKDSKSKGSKRLYGTVYNK